MASTKQMPLPQIPLLNVRAQTASIRAEIDQAIARVLDHGQFILGPEVRQLEERIAAYCGTKFAIACASGTDAILLPLMALNIGPGDRVVVPPFTFFATAGCVSRLGATPVFVDIDYGTFNLDPVLLGRYLESLSPADLATVKAIIPVHLFGQCADMPAINEIAGRFSIPVIEDAAQAIGSEFSGARAGSMGWCGTLSFFPSKNLGGIGDGGMVTTNDPSLDARLRLLRVHGSGATYFHDEVGTNSRLDTLQAAVLLAKLPHLEGWAARRQENAAAYRDAFSRLLPEGALTAPIALPDATHVYNQFTIRVRQRDEVRRRLAEMNVASAVYYPLPLHQQKCFEPLGYRAGDFPVTEAAASEVLSLPIDPELGPDSIETVVERLAVVLQSLA